jgi:hypothetical protein
MGRVFISYRSADNPWGAAGIHEWLTHRSTHRIFRDGVSLDAGAHYPTAIMAELEKADLLIAVIGPDWLTTSDPDTGQRLIDREGDWVRRELAFAFQHGIPVIPVLLKDTPRDAHQPSPADLPDDIRRLATLQSVEVGQRHLDTHLSRLAAQILRVLPAGNSPVRVPRETFYSLVDALEAIPCLSTDDTRAVLISQLRPAIAGAVRYSPQRRIHTMNIVRSCLDYEGGLAEMIATIRHIEGPDSLPFQGLTAAAHVLLPELRPDGC